MVILFVLGIGLVLLAIVLIGSALSTSTQSGVTRSLAVLEAMTNAPKELNQELEKSFGERVLAPLQARAVGLGRRISGADTAERIRRKLDLAGNPAGWTVDRVLSGKVTGAVVGLVGGLVFQLMLTAPTVRLVVVVLATVVGFFAPNLYLYQKSHERGGSTAARPARRHRPAHHQRGVRPRLRRGPAAGGPQHRGPARRGAVPGHAGDADRPGPR